MRITERKSGMQIRGMSNRQVDLMIETMKHRIWHMGYSVINEADNEEPEIAELRAMILILETKETV